MKFTFVNLTVILMVAVFLSSACTNNNSTADGNASTVENSNRNAGANNENANTAKDDIDELGRIIKLPLLPEEAAYWEESATDSGGGQNSAQNKKIIAVLKFSAENAAQIVAHIEKIKPPVDSTIDSDSRFPAELVAQSQLSGDETLKGKSYAADDFLQPPYENGKITRVENTNYFVLELTRN